MSSKRFFRSFLRASWSKGYLIFVSGFFVATVYFVASYNFFLGVNIPLVWSSIYYPPVFRLPNQVDKNFSNNIIDQTNAERSKEGLVPLKESSVLSYAAYLRAKDIFRFQTFSHEATRGGEVYNDYLSKTLGYRYEKVGENLAQGFDDPYIVISTWLISPSHKENLLDRDFNEIGVAVLEGTLLGNTSKVIVQLFGNSH